MSYPPTFQYLSFHTANVFDVQSMLFSAFVSKSFIIFLCCYGIQAFRKAQKYEWLTHQTIYANSIFCFCFLVFFSNSSLLIELVMGVYFMCLFAQIFKTNLCYTYIVFGIRIQFQEISDHHCKVYSPALFNKLQIGLYNTITKYLFIKNFMLYLFKI